MREIVLIAHNLRSTHNIGSLLRTAEGLGVNTVYLTGYTPYPKSKKDTRLPHLAAKIDKQIAKTALGAENYLDWYHRGDIMEFINELKDAGYMIAALEQSPRSIRLPDFKPRGKIALVVGREVEGIETEILELCDKVLEIPMLGKKESFNLVQAAAMALYHIKFALV